MNIVNYSISELRQAEYNPRKLTEKQFEDLKASLQEFGAVDPAVVNTHPTRENVIVGGHQRIRAWEDLGNSNYPCVEVNLEIDKEKELNIRLNKSGGSFDFDILANEFETEDLIDWGFEEWELGIDSSVFDDEETPMETNEDIKPEPDNSVKENECPACGHKF